MMKNVSDLVEQAIVARWALMMGNLMGNLVGYSSSLAPLASSLYTVYKCGTLSKVGLGRGRGKGFRSALRSHEHSL